MPNQQAEETLLEVVKDLRNWIRVAAYTQVKALLGEALPDAKSRKAYQMFDGQASGEQIRVACKMSPNAVVALTTRCTALGLMGTNTEKKRLRLFDLNDFGLIPEEENNSPEGKSERKKTKEG
jgi:hypothetical protein